MRADTILIKNLFFVPTIFLIIFLEASCKKDNKQSQTNYFWGDSTMAKSDYFNSIKGENGYDILKQQNELYSKKIIPGNKDLGVIRKGKLTINLVAKKTENKDVNVMLYTIMNDKKMDSIQFYRYSENIRYPADQYFCLSYFDDKTNKIWQTKYFTFDKEKLLEIAALKEAIILPNGTIKENNLHFLDESLEEEIQKHHLSY